MRHFERIKAGGNAALDRGLQQHLFDLIHCDAVGERAAGHAF